MGQGQARGDAGRGGVRAVDRPDLGAWESIDEFPKKVLCRFFNAIC